MSRVPVTAILTILIAAVGCLFTAASYNYTVINNRADSADQYINVFETAINKRHRAQLDLYLSIMNQSSRDEIVRNKANLDEIQGMQEDAKDKLYNAVNVIYGVDIPVFKRFVDIHDDLFVGCITRPSRSYLLGAYKCATASEGDKVDPVCESQLQKNAKIYLNNSVGRGDVRHSCGIEFSSYPVLAGTGITVDQSIWRQCTKAMVAELRYQNSMLRKEGGLQGLFNSLLHMSFTNTDRGPQIDQQIVEERLQNLATICTPK